MNSKNSFDTLCNIKLFANNLIDFRECNPWNFINDGITEMVSNDLLQVLKNIAVQNMSFCCEVEWMVVIDTANEMERLSSSFHIDI